MLECNVCGNFPRLGGLITDDHKAGDQCPCCFIPDKDCDGTLVEVPERGPSPLWSTAAEHQQMCEWEEEQTRRLVQTILESLSEETRKAFLQHKDFLVKAIDATLTKIKADPDAAQQRCIRLALGIPLEAAEPKNKEPNK